MGVSLFIEEIPPRNKVYLLKSLLIITNFKMTDAVDLPGIAVHTVTRTSTFSHYVDVFYVFCAIIAYHGHFLLAISLGLTTEFSTVTFACVLSNRPSRSTSVIINMSLLGFLLTGWSWKFYGINILLNDDKTWMVNHEYIVNKAQFSNNLKIWNKFE